MNDRQRLQDFARMGSDWLWETDTEDRFAFFSVAASQQGVDPDGRIGRKRRDFAMPEPENHARLVRIENLVRARKPFHNMAYRVDNSEGVPQWCEITGEPQFDPSGAFTGYRGVGRNISSLVEAQAALELKSRKLEQIAADRTADLVELERVQSAIIAQISGMVYRCRNDRDWTMLFVSEGSRKLLGVPAEDLVSGAITYNSLIHPDDQETVWEKVQEDFARDDAFELEYRVRHADGTWRWVEDRAHPVKSEDGGIVGLVGLILDIDSRKLTELDLERTRDNLTDAVESLDHSLVLYDSDDRVAIFNKHIHSLFPGSDRYYALGRTFEEIFRAAVESGEAQVPPGQTKEHFIAERVARHKRADGTITRRRLSSGRMLHMSDHRSQSGGIVVIGRDVTDRLKIEEQLRQSQKLDAIGKLTGGVAHDFNNILMVILANVDAMLESGDDAADAKKRLEGIASAGQRAAQLTQQLLAFSRKQTLQPQWTNLNDLVVTTGALLRRTLGEHFELDSLLAEDLWPTDVDRAQVEAAVVNLCINARDAMPGGGRIVIETRNAALDADYVTNIPDATAGDHVILSVTDSGSGIPPEILAKVFEPFFTTKEVGKGTGLGLSMIYGFVRQSNGHVTIHSEVGRGTTVALYLPRSQQNAVAEKEKPRTGDPRGTEWILVVEDEQAVREILVQQLSGLGYAVTEAENGADALALLRSGQAFDLLLTDIIMPGPINGKALADEAVKLSAGLPVLFMSGYSEDAISTLGILDSGVMLLSKPFRKRDLALAVRRQLDHAKEK